MVPSSRHHHRDASLSAVAFVIVQTIQLLAIPCHSWVTGIPQVVHSRRLWSRPQYHCPSALSMSSSSSSSSSWIADENGGSWESKELSVEADETLRWCQNFVVPLSLCPWATGSLEAPQGAIQLYSVSKPEEMEEAIASATKIFHDGIVSDILDPVTAISFVVCNGDPTTWDFVDFYDWFCDLEEQYWEDGDDDGDINNKITLAPFHPDWTFEGDDPAISFEKKSPYPTVTIVWTAVIDAAGESVTNKIAQQNEATLLEQGADALQKLYQQSVYLDTGNEKV